jgi:hypothetical protein
VGWRTPQYRRDHSPCGEQPNGTCRRDNVASHLAICSTRRMKCSRHATAPDIIRRIVVMRNISTVAPLEQSPNRSGRRSNRSCRGAASDSWPVASDAIDTRRLLEPLPRFTPSRSSAMRTGPLSSALSTINESLPSPFGCPQSANAIHIVRRRHHRARSITSPIPHRASSSEALPAYAMVN